ncbi:YgiT-type zinc finger protein [Alicyclobacillus sendaiensis]|uniref:YgiT-type zinc finger protein n=1 Tax=Alicyclobacillus sendaiensis TaxID=192387 RepID=UPI0009FAC24C
MTMACHINGGSMICMCGKIMDCTKGTVTRVIKGQPIRILNAPYYQCPQCGEIEFDLSSRISSIAVDAYRRNLSEVDFDDYCNK